MESCIGCFGCYRENRAHHENIARIRRSLLDVRADYKNLQENPDTTATCSHELKPHDSRNPAALIGHIAGRARSIDNDVINHA